MKRQQFIQIVGVILCGMIASHALAGSCSQAENACLQSCQRSSGGAATTGGAAYISCAVNCQAGANDCTKRSLVKPQKPVDRIGPVRPEILDRTHDIPQRRQRGDIDRGLE